MKTTRKFGIDGTIHASAFDLRFSTFASSEARDIYVEYFRSRDGEYENQTDTEGLDEVGIVERRRRADEETLKLLEEQQARWGDAVKVEPVVIDGVYTEVFVPRRGVPATNRDRVLINLHGGGMIVGARTHGQVESIPIAGVGQIKVVSIDYRLAPEHSFPAASEDVATVYGALLNDYRPENIGIYGSSAGGGLTASAVPWFLKQGLPLPGAVGMFGATGEWAFRGDSASLTAFVYDGTPGLQVWLEGDYDSSPYFKTKDYDERIAAPMRWPDILSQFPPSLLITASRAVEMSSVIDAHNKLTLAGVRSRLHVWDGLGHCFYLHPGMPESLEAERIIVDFFAETLGGTRAS